MPLTTSLYFSIYLCIKTNLNDIHFKREEITLIQSHMHTLSVLGSKILRFC